LDSFLEGIREAAPEAEIQEIRLYDYTFSGCKSCFACQMKNHRAELQCFLKDDLTQLLKDTRSADGIVFASPMYYCNVSAQLRAFWERLMYPGACDHVIPTALICTGNASEEQFKQYMGVPTDINLMYLKGCFQAEPKLIISGNTYQYNDQDIYNDAFRAPAKEKWQHHEEQFPIDLRTAKDAGIRMAEKIMEAGK
ncbi:MAG: flavodoxin family protein, partial [Clostridia bacterium]|nr:flavodoxin family protein [Clostridia bacterium]